MLILYLLLIVTIRDSKGSSVKIVEEANNEAQTIFANQLKSFDDFVNAIDLHLEGNRYILTNELEISVKKRFNEALNTKFDSLILIGNEVFDNIDQIDNVMSSLIMDIKTLWRELSTPNELRLASEDIINRYRTQAVDLFLQLYNKSISLQTNAIREWTEFQLTFKLLGEHLRYNEILMNLRNEIQFQMLYTKNIDDVIKTITEFIGDNHPIGKILIKSGKQGGLDFILKLIDLSDEEYYNPNPATNKAACDLEQMIHSNTTKDKITQYIEHEVPDNLKNKFLSAFNSGGYNGLLYVVHPMCDSSSEFYALSYLSVTEDIIVTLKENNNVYYEQLLYFIEWLRVYAQIKFQISSQQVFNDIDLIGKMALSKSEEIFKPIQNYDNFKTLIQDMETIISERQKNKNN